MSQIENGNANGENQYDKDKLLFSLYYDLKNPTAYGSLAKIYRYLKSNREYDNYNITRGYLAKWLSKQEVFGVHKSVRRKFKRPQILAFYEDYLWDLDSASMVKYKEYNDDYAYFAVFIDIFTRFLYTYPLKTLRGEEMVKAMEVVFRDRQPTLARSDRGSEYMNVNVMTYLKNKQISQYFTTHETKANYAERVIRTVKLRLIKYMNHNETYRWVDVLDKITAGYNNSYHRSIKMSPIQAQKIDKYTLWKNQYGSSHLPNPRKINYKYKEGDRVRISYLKGTFDREYSEKWSTEVFTVIDRKLNQNIPMYRLKDYNNDVIQGYFYQFELQPAFIDENTVYKIEKVIKSRTRAKKKEFLIKWKGWPSKYNSWITDSELKDFRNE